MTRPSVLITRRWPASAVAHLRVRYDVTMDEADSPLTKKALTDAMGKFDALCPAVSDRIDGSIIAAPNPRVRVIGNFGVGVDHIDLEAARNAGIVVTNTPGVLTEATAELAITLILMTTRRAGEGERQLRAGKWVGWHPTHLMGQGLSGKVLGLVGFGRIAQATARIAREAFGMRIAYHSRKAVPGADAEYYEDLDRLVAAADIVSLHCPGGKETFHLLDGRRLSLMKRAAVLINTARGTVVDEAALAESLRSGSIAAAGLDVYEREPIVHPALLDLENVVLLPHLGSATIETRTAMAMLVAKNLDAFFDGQPLPNRVA
ncbi:MAG: D-glycerate dehydrogenase [Alphaproteobacteria bacterium]